MNLNLIKQRKKYMFDVAWSMVIHTRVELIQLNFTLATLTYIQIIIIRSMRVQQIFPIEINK